MITDGREPRRGGMKSSAIRGLYEEIDELRSLLERAEDGLTTIMKPNWGKTFEVIEELNQLLIDIRAKLGVK